VAVEIKNIAQANPLFFCIFDNLNKNKLKIKMMDTFGKKLAADF
jgi:hypothetical protein